jgi:hypothetical protein
VLSLSLVIIGLDNTILNVALPTLVRELGATASELQWIVDAYVLVFAGLLLTMGAIGDQFGRKLALNAGLVLFGLSSVAAASLAISAGASIKAVRSTPRSRRSSRTAFRWRFSSSWSGCHCRSGRSSCFGRSREPLHGALQAERFLADLGRRMSVERISLVLADVNGQPGAITTDSSGRVVAAISLDMVEDRVHAMRTVTNPDKLGHVSVS